jgi:hypothetical protein
MRNIQLEKNEEKNSDGNTKYFAPPINIPEPWGKYFIIV